MTTDLSRITHTLRHYLVRLDRIQIAGFLLFGYALLVLSTVFGYTILDHSYYKGQADRQQTMKLQNTDTRGSIYSRTTESSPRWVFAVSTNLGTLAIDPTQTGSVSELTNFLSELVYSEFCHTPGDSCLDSMSAYTKQDLRSIPDLTDIMLKKMIADYITTRMKSPIDAVQVQEKVSDTIAAQVDSIGDPSLYFVADNLYVNPTLVEDPIRLASRLSPLLGMKQEEIEKKFEIRARRHLEIIRRMSLFTRDTLTNRIKTEQEAVKQKQMDISDAVYPFIKIEDNLTRFYPEQSVGWQIIGFVDGDGKGQYGIEWYFDEELSGKSPVQEVKKDSSGRPIEWYVSREAEERENGVDISLTIDRNIQKEIRSRLMRAVRDFRANKGSVVVTDPKTGAVIATVNYPDFDPNSYTDVYAMERVSPVKYPNPIFDLIGMPVFVEDSLSGTLMTRFEGKRVMVRSATEDELQNTAIPKYKYTNGYGPWVYNNLVIGGLYEPGSVFKAITVAIGIDSGEIHPYDTYFDRGYVELDVGASKPIKISNIAHQCTGLHPYTNALNWSCNVGMISIIQKVGKSIFHKYLYDFGFGDKTGITLDGEVFGQIAPYEKWSRTQLFTMSFGQGINATLLQMAAAYGVLANSGVYMKPYIVDSMTYPDGRVVKTIPTPLRQVVKPETAKQVTAMLIDGVRRGFAAKGGVAGYVVAGKTGTAQIPYKGTYENLYFHSDLGHTITSYGGFAPANDPKFVLIVEIDRPRSSVYSETTASALFSEIAGYLLQYYKVPKN